MLVAGLDVGGSSVTAWISDLDRPGQAALAVRALTVRRRAPHRAELDPAALEAGCRRALQEVVEQTGRPGRDFLGVTVSSTPQAFVLLDAAGQPLGDIVLDSDRRGRPFAHVLAGTYGLTGHWPAPELALPKLLAVRADEPQRWAASRRVLFVHDWLLWRLSGVQVTEVSYACAGGMADVAGRHWATSLLEDVGVAVGRLAPVVEPGTTVGELLDGWPLPAQLPVVAGCGHAQLAALAAGGLGEGVVTVLSGSSTPVTVAARRPVSDPLGRPWVCTHALPGVWMAEGDAGPAGEASRWWEGLLDRPGPARTPSGLVAVTAVPYRSPQTWAPRPPAALVGLRPDTTAEQVRGALLEAQAFGVRGNIEDLERALGRPVSAVVLTGAAASGPLPDLLARVLGRDVHRHPGPGAPGAGSHLVARSVGAHSHLPGLPPHVWAAGDPAPWQEPYSTWLATTLAGARALRTTPADVSEWPA